MMPRRSARVGACGPADQQAKDDDSIHVCVSLPPFDHGGSVRDSAGKGEFAAAATDAAARGSRGMRLPAGKNAWIAAVQTAAAELGPTEVS